jgi:hypothetical protein
MRKPGSKAGTAIVAIGRNEGTRLVRCLESLRRCRSTVVYVDSGSTDGSVAAARARGLDVVELTPDRPFTAARGRNAGFARLAELAPDIERVQFIDGDCELAEGWPSAAEDFLDSHPDVAAVAGRRREREPGASPYNRLADMEWDTPIGEAGAFGGDVMVRADAFREVGGYDESLIAGEDPDLAFRLRQHGHRVFRLDEEMTLHDAAMHRFSELWRRQVRCGHAFAELAQLHGYVADPGTCRSVCSILVWGGLLPAAIVSLAWSSPGMSIGLAALYPVQALRIFGHTKRAGRPTSDSALYAAACLVGKFAELRGVGMFVWNRWVRRRRSKLIEYKGATPIGHANSAPRG